MKKIIILLLTATCLLLTACSYSNAAILVLYSQDDNTTYLYDQYGNFYAYDNSVATPIARNFEETPALQLYPVENQFTLNYVSAGKYCAEFEDICAYVTALQNEGYTLDVVSTSPYLLEAHLSSESVNLKLYISSDKYVRIYVEENGEGVLPPHTNSESLNIED